MMTTNALNNECLNDFTVTGASSGSLRKLSVQSDYNVASTSSLVEHYIAGTTADDPYSAWIIGTTASHALGIDVNDSQSLKLGYNAGAAATPSSTCFYESDSDCHNFYPYQPCCRAYVTGSQTNVTGDGTEVTVQFNTEEFDIGSNYNTGTYTFTAPIDGRYLINTCVYFEGIDSNKTGTYISIYKNAGQLVRHITRAYGLGSGAAQAFPINVITDLAASDTIHVTLIVYGTNKTIDIVPNASNTSTYLSIYLVG